jgi:hypothetical protein
LLANSAVVCTFAACLLAIAPASLDRRVVDRVDAGDADSEALHGYAGHDAASGAVRGKAYRQARGWMRYALSTFDDTEVTLAFTFVATDSMPRGYDVIVEDSLVASPTLAPGGAELVVVEQRVPFALTKGKANIAVTIRGRGGFTPALHEVRTVQDHNEDNTPGVVK